MSPASALSFLVALAQEIGTKWGGLAKKSKKTARKRPVRAGLGGPTYRRKALSPAPRCHSLPCLHKK